MKVEDPRPVIVISQWSSLRGQWGYIKQVSSGMLLVAVGDKMHWLGANSVKFASDKEIALKNLEEYLK